MYKMSEVVYRLENGQVVTTLSKARESGLSYTIEYHPFFETYGMSEKKAQARRKLY